MITPNPIPVWLRIAAPLGVVLAIFLLGCRFEGWRKNVEIADLKRDAAQQQANNADAALHRLQQAQARGDVLTSKLQAAESTIDTLAQEKNDAIRRLTVGRRCLDSAAVRVLNQPTGLQAVAVPTAAGQPAADDAAFATDTDVGLWITQCQRGYETCRGRLQAVADFFTDPPADSVEQ